MRVICSYCQAPLGTKPGGRPTDVSHGMCEPCALHFERLWAGMGMGEYLDGLAQAVVVLDAHSRVLAANAKAAELVGHRPAAPRGLLTGEAMACSHSRLPGGCGKTVHCRDCAIRNTVTSVAKSGRPMKGVRGYLEQDGRRVPLRLSARPVDGGVEVTLEEEKEDDSP